MCASPLLPPGGERLTGLGARGVRAHGGAGAGQLSGRGLSAGGAVLCAPAKPFLAHPAGALAAAPAAGREHYDQRCAWLLARGLGLWDVYASCERVGSLDTRIRNAQVNDFASLRARCPRLAAIAHNGGESFKHARSTALLGVEVHRLPSTSPANASWSFDRKLTAWAELLARHGLV
jgi:hypoxanthine-DNA glycosylase